MANDDLIMGHSEFVPYPTPQPDPILRAFSSGPALPGGAVSFEHLAAQTRARRPGAGSSKCAHGYWVHAHDPCPHCWGVHPGRNDDVVPHQGPGNGWMLRKGDPACLECGGPANAGYGLIPDGMTPEELARERARPKKCYGCSVEGGESIVRREPRQELLASGWEGTDLPTQAPPFNPGKERF